MRSSGNCQFCESAKMHLIMDLGEMPNANSYLRHEREFSTEPSFPLNVWLCEDCGLVQLGYFIGPEHLFSDYAYASSYSTSWLQHAKRYVTMVSERFQLDKTSQVVEIGSNDGYLLQYFVERKIPVLGIEPADNIAGLARAKQVPTRTGFWSLALAEELSSEYKADLIIANNVLAHVPDIRGFVAGLRRLLKPRGIVTLEVPHVLELVQRNAFDTIYHEHFYYFSLTTLRRLFAAFGLEIFDVEILKSHGGSLRVYAKHALSHASPSSAVLEGTLAEERMAGLGSPRGYETLPARAREMKAGFLNFLDGHVLKAQRTLLGYGAAAKGNTFLNYCRVSSALLPAVVDKNPLKQGRYLPGSHIPILSPDVIGQLKPHTLLILPWNLKHEIMAAWQVIETWGGRFVTADLETLSGPIACI